MQAQVNSDDALHAHHHKVDPESECPSCGRPFYRRFKANWFVRSRDGVEHVYEHMVLKPDFGDEDADWYTTERCTY